VFFQYSSWLLVLRRVLLRVLLREQRQGLRRVLLRVLLRERRQVLQQGMNIQNILLVLLQTMLLKKSIYKPLPLLQLMIHW
jgi:hypothetical protein